MAGLAAHPQPVPHPRAPPQAAKVQRRPAPQPLPPHGCCTIQRKKALEWHRPRQACPLFWAIGVGAGLGIFDGVMDGAVRRLEFNSRLVRQSTKASSHIIPLKRKFNLFLGSIGGYP